MNVKVKLTGWYLILFMILMLIFCCTAYFLLSDGLKKKTVHPWEMRYGSIEAAPDNRQVITGFYETPVGYADTEAQPFLVTHFSSTELDELVAAEGKIPVGGILIEESALGAIPEPTDYTIWLYTDFSGELKKAVAIVGSLDEVKAVLGTFTWALILAGSVTLVVACVGGYWLAKRSLKPVTDMAETVRDIAESNLDVRLDDRNKDEMGYLATTFNRMLSRLHAAFQREKEFTADASHELRSPLAVIQSEASLALSRERSELEYRRSLETILNETEYMGSVLKRLLYMARYENSNEIGMDELNLRTLLEDLKSDIEILCEEKTIRCVFITGKDLFIKGNLTGLRVMFFNIIENAVKYTGEGGEILVDLSEEKNNAVVTISDTGIGIAEQHLPNIFKRFYRVNRSEFRSGAGLGLAISLRIAELHRGTITVESKTGTGSIFSVRLPYFRR